jgi:radical SAM protein with 4Fe4S-binding SPASM domain
MNNIKPIDAAGNLDPAAAVYLMLSMTKRCNMRCPGCYYLQQDENFFKNQDIGLEDAKEIVRHYRAAGVKQAIPNAEGDVLLHPEYRSLVGYINSLGFNLRPWLVTNGIRLPEVAEFVVRNMGEVLVSVDGSTHEKYTAHRGGNEALFRKVMAGIRSVVNAAKGCSPRPEIIINCVMTADRCDDMPEMIHLAEELGVDTIKFTNYHVTGEGLQKTPLSAGDPKIDAVLRGIVSRKDYVVSILLPTLYGNTQAPFACKMLASINVGSNGDFAPCCRMMPESKWGNYFTSPAKHNNDALKEFRLSVINAASHDQLPVICRKCSHLSPKRLIFVKNRTQWYLTTID